MPTICHFVYLLQMSGFQVMDMSELMIIGRSGKVQPLGKARCRLLHRHALLTWTQKKLQRSSGNIYGEKKLHVRWFWFKWSIYLSINQFCVLIQSWLTPTKEEKTQPPSHQWKTQRPSIAPIDLFRNWFQKLPFSHGSSGMQRWMLNLSNCESPRAPKIPRLFLSLGQGQTKGLQCFFAKPQIWIYNTSWKRWQMNQSGSGKHLLYCCSLQTLLKSHWKKGAMTE